MNWDAALRSKRLRSLRRGLAVVIASTLIAAALLRSPLRPLSVLVLLGAAVGLLIALRTEPARDLRRLPILVALAVLAIVGIGHLGVLGIVLGVLLLVTVPASDRRW